MKELILELRKNGFSYSEISKKLNCSKSTISYHCSKLEGNDETKKENLKIKNKKQKRDSSFLLDKDKVDEIIKLRKEKKKYNEIREVTGSTLLEISKVCRLYGLSKTHKYGELSEIQILDIRNKYSELKSIRKVSKLTGFARETIMKYIDKIEKNILSKSKRNSIAVTEWRKRKKIELVKLKGGACEKCGYNKCVDALEFHHKDPNEKDFTISGKSFSFEKLKKEVDKCILVCSNCHKEIHYEIKYSSVAQW